MRFFWIYHARGRQVSSFLNIKVRIRYAKPINLRRSHSAVIAATRSWNSDAQSGWSLPTGDEIPRWLRILADQRNWLRQLWRCRACYSQHDWKKSRHQKNGRPIYLHIRHQTLTARSTPPKTPQEPSQRCQALWYYWAWRPRQLQVTVSGIWGDPSRPSQGLSRPIFLVREAY